MYLPSPTIHIAAARNLFLVISCPGTLYTWGVTQGVKKNTHIKYTYVTLCIIGVRGCYLMRYLVPLFDWSREQNHQFDWSREPIRRPQIYNLIYYPQFMARFYRYFLWPMKREHATNENRACDQWKFRYPGVFLCEPIKRLQCNYVSKGDTGIPLVYNKRARCTLKYLIGRERRRATNQIRVVNAWANKMAYDKGREPIRMH